MNVFGGLCETCYGLAIDCSHCNVTGRQPKVNPGDLGDWRAISRSRGPDNLPNSLAADSIGSEGQAKHMFQPEREEFSDLIGADLELSSKNPSASVTLEQKDQIPPYRRHTKSKAQVKLLKDWFSVNPNPTGPQLSEYAKLASLEKDQVRNWFVNQRRPSRNHKSKKTSKGEFRHKASGKKQPKQGR